MPEIKIADRLPSYPSDEDLAHFQQLGIDAASTWTTIKNAHYDYLATTRQRLADHGIELFNVGILDLHCDPTMVRSLSGFDQKLEQYVRYLRDRGVPPDRFKELLGHKTMAMVLRYAKARPEQTREAVAALNLQARDSRLYEIVES